MCACCDSRHFDEGLFPLTAVLELVMLHNKMLGAHRAGMRPSMTTKAAARGITAAGGLPASECTVRGEDTRMCWWFCQLKGLVVHDGSL